MKLFIKNNYPVILAVFLVGAIYLAPSLFFVLSLGDSYQGIPMMQTANEDTYLSRIHEILDGYPAIGSFSFFEYKDQPPLSPPGGEFIYALPSLVFGAPLVNVLVVSRFILPMILFLLVYFLIRRLTASLPNLSNKFNAIAGAFWAVLGYDLIDFRGVWNFLTGKQDVLAGYFLLWSRPVNPILGAIFLFSFLLLLWSLWHKTRYRKTYIFFAGFFLALMIMSYFFSWGMALSIWGILLVIALVKKDWGAFKSFLGILPVTLILALPYWYWSWQANQSPWYANSVLRSGLFYTHYPLFNKFLMAVLAVFLILVGGSLWTKNRPFSWSLGYFKKIFDGVRSWQWFCLAFILGAFWAFSQQVVTGITIWPYHFVQYSIPLAIVVLTVLLFNIIKEKSVYLWGGSVALIMIVSLACGIYAQASVYRDNFSYYADAQLFAGVFDWLNQRPKDCVVLTRQDEQDVIKLNTMIPAFTHCNNLVSTDGIFVLMPEDRLLYNYLVFLRINNVKPENIENHLAVSGREAEAYLFSNWKGLHHAVNFPDVSDKMLAERIKNIPRDYREFYAKNFKEELSRYRLDYILSVGPLSPQVIEQLSGLKIVFQKNNIFAYSF